MKQMVSEMTKEELRQIIESSVENKFLEWFSDPGDGLVLRDDFLKRLMKSKAAVERGERGRSLDDVARRLGL